LKMKMIMLVFLILSLLCFQASAGCGKWVVRDNTDFLADPTFDEAIKSSTGDLASVKNENTTTTSAEQSDQKQPIEENQNQEAEKQTQNKDVSGKWLFDLQQKLGSSLDLILIQTGDRLQGYGTLTENGAKTAATVTGYINKDSLELDVKAVIDHSQNEDSKKYEMKLQALDNTLVGHYDLYLSDELAGEGNATAKKSG
jgi:hypothetical protein